AGFFDDDFPGHFARGELDRFGKRFMAADRGVIAEQDALGRQHLAQGADDVVTQRLEAGREQLHHEPAVVAVYDQAGESVALGVYHAIGCGSDTGAPAEGEGDALLPPGLVDGSVLALEQSQPDFRRRRVECLALELSPPIKDRDHAGLWRSMRDVARLNPGMTMEPTLGPALAHTGPRPGTVAHRGRCRLRGMDPNLAPLLRLMLVTDDGLLEDRDLVVVCLAAARGGVTSVELRLK